MPLDRCEFVNTPEWDQCKDYLWDSFPKKYFQVFEDELITIYQQQLVEVEKLTDTTEALRINTYLSAKSFEEAIGTRVKIPMAIVGGTFATEIDIPKRLAFPVSFLSKSVKEGFSILCDIHYEMLKIVSRPMGVYRKVEGAIWSTADAYRRLKMSLEMRLSLMKGIRKLSGSRGRSARRFNGDSKVNARLRIRQTECR